MKPRSVSDSCHVWVESVDRAPLFAELRHWGLPRWGVSEGRPPLRCGWG